MVAILSLAVFALLAARVAGAPPGTWRYVAGAAALALLASQVLPQGSPWRADLPGSARTLFWLAVAAAPVGAYAMWVRGLRRRSVADAPAPRPRRGLVQFAADDALAAETAAALDAETADALPGRRVSLGWRGEDGALEGHLRLRVSGEAAEIEMLRVAPAARRRGVGGALLRAAEGEAAAQGARRIGALVGDWQAPAAFERSGYAPVGAAVGPGAGRGRRWMEKPL